MRAGDSYGHNMTIPVRAEQPPGLPVSGRLRPPWNLWLLAIVTLGVYAIVHHWTVNRELRDFGVEVDPVKATLAVFPGVLVVVPFLVTVYRTADRIAVAQETIGLPVTIRPAWAPVGALLALLHIPYLQSELNRVWDIEANDEANGRGRQSIAP